MPRPAAAPLPSPLPRRPGRLWWALGLLVLLLLGGIGLGLRQLYLVREQDYRHQIERELQAIGQLQSRTVGEWRERRMLNAMALTDDSLLAHAVARWQQAPADALATPVRERLRILQERTRYSAAFLVDVNGRLQLAPEDVPAGNLPEAEQQALQQALEKAQAVFIEPRRDTLFAYPYFGVMAPLYDGIVPLGALWLVSDVRATLYPLLESWPTPSRSAESVLVARDGDDLVYLSPLRHRSDTPLSVRLPLVQGDNPAMQAVQGGRGILYGHDYRGESVMAMVSAVPEAPWFLVSKIDMAEALRDMRLREWLALGLPVSLLLLLAGLSIAYWQWRARRREQHLKRELERNLHWLDTAQKAATVGYFAYDAAEKQFFMSPMVSQIYGLPANGRMSLREWVHLLHPEDRAQVLAVHGKAMQEHSPLHMQYRIVRVSDQQTRWVQVWGEYDALAPNPTDAMPRMTGTVQDITDRKLAEEQLAAYRAALEAQVRTDPLTQVANRRALDEALTNEWSRATRSNAPLSLLMLDVDHFKAYNDHYGHVAGDHCLRQVAQALAASITRAGEVVARYGGEEFAVLLPHTDLAQALELAEQLRLAVKALGLEHCASPLEKQVTVSIGAACIQPQAFTGAAPGAPQPTPFPDAAEAVQALVYQADSALYNAKKAGRDRAMACPAPSVPLVQ